MRYFKNITIFFFFFFLFSLSVSFLRSLDVTQKPRKSDIIFCLGGNKYRTYKSLMLLSNNYSKYNTLYFFGGKKLFYNHLKHLHIDGMLIDPIVLKKNIIFIANMKNTMDEIQFIKKVSSSYGYSNLIIVTDPTHSFRVKLMLDTFTKNLNYIIVSSKPAWANKKDLNVKMIIFTIKELFKIPYNYVKYKVYFLFLSIL